VILFGFTVIFQLVFSAFCVIGGIGWIACVYSDCEVTIWPGKIICILYELWGTVGPFLNYKYNLVL
jgi:hypothetical protein